MWKYLWLSLLAACLAASSLALNAQESPTRADKGETKPGASTPSKPDYSKEMKETKARLEHLGGAKDLGSFRATANEELNKMRTVRLERVTQEPATADFLIIFGAGSKVEEVK